MVLAMQRGPVVVPSSPAVPQQQHGPNALQMSEPSSFNISLTLHQSYQVSPRFRLDKISQGCGKGGGGLSACSWTQLCCSVEPASSCGSCSVTERFNHQEAEPRRGWLIRQRRLDNMHDSGCLSGCLLLPSIILISLDGFLYSTATNTEAFTVAQLSPSPTWGLNYWKRIWRHSKRFSSILIKLVPSCRMTLNNHKTQEMMEK